MEYAKMEPGTRANQLDFSVPRKIDFDAPREMLTREEDPLGKERWLKTNLI